MSSQVPALHLVPSSLTQNLVLSLFDKVIHIASVVTAAPLKFPVHASVRAIVQRVLAPV